MDTRLKIRMDLLMLLIFELGAFFLIFFLECQYSFFDFVPDFFPFFGRIDYT